MNTHGLICDFGKYSGTPYTRLPGHYLLAMVNSRHENAEIAKAELERRGTVIPEIEVSGHAIDSASKRLLSLWIETRETDEGLYHWLVRKCEDAIKDGIGDDGNVIKDGVKYCFAEGEWPVLKTVMRV